MRLAIASREASAQFVAAVVDRGGAAVEYLSYNDDHTPTAVDDRGYSRPRLRS